MKQFWLVAAAALVVTTLLPDGAFAQRGGFRGGAIGGGFRGAAIGGGFRGVGPGIARVGPGFRATAIGGGFSAVRTSASTRFPLRPQNPTSARVARLPAAPGRFSTTN